MNMVNATEMVKMVDFMLYTFSCTYHIILCCLHFTLKMKKKKAQPYATYNKLILNIETCTQKDQKQNK